MDLFNPPKENSKSPSPRPYRSNRPLAYRARPKSFEDFIGHEAVFTNYPFLKGSHLPSLIIWGPPGTGKTTLASLLASNLNIDIYPFSAVLGGVKELKKLIDSSLEMKKFHGNESIIFIDEIHRFNKAQQDALLPYVESGDFTFIGATTENPLSSVNRALLSRLQIIELNKLSVKDIKNICSSVAQKFDIEISNEVLQFIASNSNGDARTGLNTLEIIKNFSSKTKTSLSVEEVKKLVANNIRDYDKNGDRHYDVISAFIKSMRASDSKGAILWLAVMLDGGEDPIFIARRMIIFASEDIGNANPFALTHATSALTAVQNIGMPEGRIVLAQVVEYLATTSKSRSSYEAIDNALKHVRNNPTIEVPLNLRNK